MEEGKRGRIPSRGLELQKGRISRARRWEPPTFFLGVVPQRSVFPVRRVEPGASSLRARGGLGKKESGLPGIFRNRLLPDCLPELASLGPGPRRPSLLAGDRSVPPRASEPLADPGIPGQVPQTRAGTLQIFQGAQVPGAPPSSPRGCKPWQTWAIPDRVL